MYKEVMEAVVLIGICLVVAALVVTRVISPWLDARDKSLEGRARNVVDALERSQRDRATAYGTRARTIWVSAVNIGFLSLIAVLATRVTFWVLSYPVIGLVVLRICRVARDERLNARAGLSERISMRLFQVWQWPILAYWLLRFPSRRRQ